MITTAPFKSAKHLATPVSEVMHHGVVALPAKATLADAVTVLLATGATHILVGASAGEPPLGVVADSDLVAFVAR